MNWQHFRAFLWLRWRLGLNQLRRAGIANLVVLILLGGCALIFALSMFAFAVLAGIFLLGDVSPSVLMYVWDGLVVAFIFTWVMGLVVELQRSELLSLDKFLHLPVSLTSAFLINYLGSLFNLTMVFFFPGMVGLCIALVFVRGPSMLLLFPLLAGFLLMVTALTHQFRGWLAALMVNKRRRRTIIMLVTFGFVLLAQLPNLINFIVPYDKRNADKRHANEKPDDMAEQEKGNAKQAAKMDPETLARMEQTFQIVNLAIPAGWLPYGAMAAGDGNILAALAAAAGMTLIGGVSLRRSYRTTVRIYTGQLTSKPSRPAKAPSPAAQAGARAATALGASKFLQKKLPGISEQAAAITLACFRSLVRAPEAKMMLLSPIIMVLVFGSLFLTRSFTPTDYLRPLMASGAIALMLLTMIQLIGNQFGFDRSGFRVFVLSAAPRSDILLAKNLAIAPLVGVLGLIVIAIIQVMLPMRFDHLLASVAQLFSMFLVIAMMGNWLSMFAPMPIASGSLKPVNPKAVNILMNILFTFLFPVFLAPTLIPLGIEYLLHEYGVMGAVPVYLILALLEAIAVYFLFRLMLKWQGSVLQRREQKILEVVTAKVE